MELNDILAKNIPLRNAHAGKRCFIIGNGPSIATQDLGPLKDEICIVVSSFHRHPLAKTISPAYWVMADPDIWAKPEKNFFPVFQRVLELAIPTRLFLPTGGFNFFAQFNTGPLIDLHFLHFNGSTGINIPIDFTGGIPPYGQNVAIISLMLAYFMGCNPIYFLGCDHDFMNITREKYENSAVKHFYPDEKAANPSEIISWDVWRQSMETMRFQYAQLHAYGLKWGFDVFNATWGGCLEEFPRVDYQSLRTANPDSASSPSSLMTEEIYHLTDVAIAMIDEEDYQSALVLLEQGLRNNINRFHKVEGIEYLKAFCLAKLCRYDEALILARQDHACNPGNREISSLLIRQLEEVTNDYWRVAQGS